MYLSATARVSVQKMREAAPRMRSEDGTVPSENVDEYTYRGEVPEGTRGGVVSWRNNVDEYP